MANGTASMESEQLSDNNEGEGEAHISLRPNCAPRFVPAQESILAFQEFTENEAPFKRKRHPSTSEDIAQSFLHTQRKAHQDKSHFSSLSPKSNSSSASSKIFRANSKVEISLEQKIKASKLADQHCNKTFCLKSSNGSPAEMHDLFHRPSSEAMFKHPPWKIDELQQLKAELNKVKGDTERGEDMQSWTDHTFKVNPAATVFSRVKAQANPEFISQAFLKFYEVLNQFPLVTPDSEHLRSVHLCEAPGAFIVALNHYIQQHHPDMQWKWLGNTLHPHYEGCEASECIPDDRIILHTLEHWVFGRDGTGDITLRSCLDELVERSCSLGHPVSVVTADGSIDCQSNPGEQEAMTARLHLCEVHAALRLLGRGGSLVLKMFTFFESSSLCLLYLLCFVFGHVNVFKPITSKLGNSEVYVVCMDYAGKDSIPEVLNVMLKQYNDPQGFSASMFAPSDIPEKFVQLVTLCVLFFKEHQENAIERNARLYGNMNDEEEATCQLVQELIWDKFRERNPLEPIPAFQRILQVDVRWDPNIHPDFGKYRKWSGCFHRFTPEKKINYVSDLLQDLIQQYAHREHKQLYFVCDNEIVENLRISRGLPFNVVGNSRFCFERCLNLYLTLINLKNDLLDIKLTIDPHKYESQKVVYLNGKDEVNGTGHLEVNDETKLLIESVNKDYPGCQFLIGEHPFRNVGPSSSCCVLERLYDLLRNKSLQPNATIHLCNMPLLTRLQNGLFALLSSCFENVDLHQTLHYYLQSGDSVSPVIKLNKLKPDLASCVVEALREAGWSPGCEQKGVWEVMDALNLIRYRSHEVVCRYNANLLLLWSVPLLAQIKY